mgnify:FL=1
MRKLIHSLRNLNKEARGIDGGKVSKLTITISGETVVEYDRGWVKELDENDKMLQIALAILLKEYN